jgi:hypothetical protein
MDPQFKRLFGIPANADRSKIMTGQLMFRKSYTSAPGDLTDRKLHIIVGIVAVPESFNIEQHILYPISGEMDANLFQDITIQLGINEAIKPEVDLNGYGLSGIVTTPMWRV